MRLVAALIISAAIVAASAMHRYRAHPLEGSPNFVVVDGLTGRTVICFGVARLCEAPLTAARQPPAPP